MQKKCRKSGHRTPLITTIQGNG